MAKAKIDKRDQAERLLRYLELLSRGGFFAVPQMAGMFGVRPEGVYRDIRRLIALGYPMETEKKSGLTVYRFPANWQRKVRKVEFSLHEIEVALLAVEQHCRLGPPHRNVQLAVGKLQALHAESGPPARVRAWNRIVREAGGVRTDSPVDSAVAEVLQRAIAEQRWCELRYRPMGSEDLVDLRFAPRELVDGTVFGASGTIDCLDVLNAGRIAAASMMNETNASRSDLDGLWMDTPAGEGEEVERVELQVLRLVATVRMLGAGKSVSATEMANAFATTLNTIRRDRALLETNGYSTMNFGSDARVSQNPAAFGSIPPLPMAAAERTAFVHVLERCAANYPPSESLRNVISKLKDVADPVVALAVSDADGGRTEGDVVWELVDAMLRKLPCSVVYMAHIRMPRMLRFTPIEFQIGPLLRIKGIGDESDGELILIVRDIHSVRILSPPAVKPPTS